MSRFVLDSHALLSFLKKEPHSVRVRDLLKSAAEGGVELHMSALNLGEVQYKLRRLGRDTSQIEAIVAGLPLHLASADAYLPQVVDLKATHPIALGDCFAAALAIDLECPVVTGDPEFHKLEKVPSVEWL